MSGFDLFAEINRVTEEWKESCARTDKVLDKMLKPKTFADLQLGDEFYCLEYGDDICFEKRSETTAICWDRDVCDRYDFLPTDRVTLLEAENQ